MGTMGEVASTNLTSIIENGEVIVDIIMDTWWGSDAYVATTTRVYLIDPSNNGYVTSHNIVVGEYAFKRFLRSSKISAKQREL